jgi:hypothetical protein
LILVLTEVSEWQYGDRESIDWRVDCISQDNILNNRSFRHEPVGNQPANGDDQQDNDHRVYLLAGPGRLRLGPIDIDLSLQSFRRHLVHPREDHHGKESEYQQQYNNRAGRFRHVEQRRQNVGELQQHPRRHEVKNGNANYVAAFKFFK